MRRSGKHLNTFRKVHPSMGKTPKDVMFGYFLIPSAQPGNHDLHVISSGESTDDVLGQWEHVSVSTPTRCPTWEEMCKVKSLFWHEHETVLQFHPAKTNYVNNHPFCLHLWKPKGEVMLPPTICV